MNLKEVDKPQVKKAIVVYAGRFQPFHQGHYKTYQKLVSKFGANNVYIGTSNVTNNDKSPFNFNEKVKIMNKMFGISSNKIVNVSNPYAPKEILTKFDDKTTAYIAAVGQKDADRLAGKYFKPYNGKTGYGYGEIGYVYPVPAETNAISGTDVRSWLGSGDDETKKKGFLKAYPKFDKDIFNMITGKLNESVNTEPSSALRPEPHPTRHETEHPEDEKKAFDGNKAPYDPIGEIMDRAIAEDIFEQFVKDYFTEAENTNPIMDKEFDYTAADGKKKKITVRGALRLSKDHPAHIQAKKMVGPDDAPANEPNAQKGKAATQAAKPAAPGQPVKKDQTAQGKANKGKGETPSEPEAPNPQKLSGAELKSKAEMPKGNEKDAEIKQRLDKVKNELSDDDKKTLESTNNPQSPERKGAWNNIKNATKAFGKGVMHWAHHQKEAWGGTADAVKALANGQKIGSTKNKETGEWEYSDETRKKQIGAMKTAATTTGLLLGSMALGGAGVAAAKAVMGGQVATAGVAALQGAAGAFTHGVSGFGIHLLKDIGKHATLEAMGLGAGSAAGVGAGLSTATGGLLEGINGMEDYQTISANVIKSALKKMETYQMTDAQMLESIESYNKQKPQQDAQQLMKGINENLSDSKQNSIQHFVEYATKRLKLTETPKVTLVGGREFAEVKTSLGGYSPETKEIYVSTEGRLTADILRTIAHEMAHRKQDEMGLVTDSEKDGADGSDIENKAHAVAGILMREYGRINKQIYNEVSNVQVSNTADVPDGAFIKKNKKRKLDGDKGEAWYSNGGYTQTEFPKADAIFGDDDGEERTVKYTIKNLPDVEYVETDFIKEDINLDVDKGDTLLMGKFKNKKVTVKDIGVDDHGMPTINGKKATTFRIPRAEDKDTTNEVHNEDWHFVAIKKLWDKASSFTRKKIAAVVTKNPNSSWDKIAKELRYSDYDEVTDYTDALRLAEMAQSNLNQIEKYADSQLAPEDIEFTKHFFDRVNDPRNGKEISDAELTGFFKRLAKHKKEFTDFLNKYKEIVVTDSRSDINIPFVKSANKVIAKTIMRKGDFKSSAPKMVNEAQAVSGGKVHKFITGKNLGFKGKKYSEIEFETLGIDNRNQTVRLKILAPKEIGGNEMSLDFRTIRRGPFIKTDTHSHSINEGLLLEGGAYGHMSHPFDDMDLTFGDLKNIIKGALTGKLELTREKTDGQALAISWKNGRLIAARNKGHLANAGANAMGIEDVATKFAGRGGLTDAYNYAMKDLSAAISGLSNAQKDKIFKEGQCFMNLEVIWPTSVNVIPYGQPLLVFHNTTCYDEKGVAIGADQSAATILAGMIKQTNGHVQSKYTIQGPPVTELPKNEVLDGKQSQYLSRLSKLQSEFGLKDSDGVAAYHTAWWANFIDKKAPIKVDKLTKDALIRRWGFYDKSFRLTTISNPELQKWAIDNDKVNVAKQQKDNIRPFEEIFLGVGADVLSFMGSVLAANPDTAVRAMKDKLKSVSAQVRTAGNPAQIDKLKKELKRLQSIGGVDKIVPNEGIVFVYKGNTYKLTGTFAPLNQILGIFYE
jgi:hypothetical protein